MKLQSPASFLKRDAVFYTFLFLVWMAVVFALHAGHLYVASPLPNELPSMQADQQAAQQQAPQQTHP